VRILFRVRETGELGLIGGLRRSFISIATYRVGPELEKRLTLASTANMRVVNEYLDEVRKAAAGDRAPQETPHTRPKPRTEDFDFVVSVTRTWKESPRPFLAPAVSIQETWAASAVSDSPVGRVWTCEYKLNDSGDEAGQVEVIARERAPVIAQVREFIRLAHALTNLKS
jgi:hypothetical protein